MTATEFLALVRKFVEAWSRHDVEGLDKLYAEGIVREGRSGEKFDKVAIRRFRQGLLRAFPDLSLEYTHQFSTGTHGVIEWTMRGTHSGTFESPMGSIPPTGKRVEWQGVSLWELDKGGLIIRERVYADDTGLFQQLGVLKVAVPVR